jgi:hypothetical protein
LANTKKRKRNNDGKISRVCLPSTPLPQNYKLKNCFKFIFDKHVFRIKYCIFPPVDFQHAKHNLKKLTGLAQPHGLGFPTQKQDPNLEIESKLKIKFHTTQVIRP